MHWRRILRINPTMTMTTRWHTSCISKYGNKYYAYYNHTHYSIEAILYCSELFSTITFKILFLFFLTTPTSSLTHEQEFQTLHTSMIKKLIGSKGSSTKQSGIPVSMDLRFIRGDFQQLKKDFPYLVNKNTVQVDKLGFPDVILPGEGRGFVAMATLYVHHYYLLLLFIIYR